MKKLKWKWDSRIVDGSTEYDITEVLKPALSKTSGCPIHKMQTFASGAKSAFDDIVKSHISGSSNFTPTLKVCHGLNVLLKNSYVIHSPCDFVLSFDSDRNYIQSFPDNSSPFFRIDTHALYQTDLDNGTNLLDGKIAFKFVFPFRIDVDCDYQFTDAFYHNKDCWRIVPGVVDKSYITNLIFFAHFELPADGEIKHITIKQGDVLAYIQFDDRYKLVMDNTMSDRPKKRTRFFRGFL